MAAAIWDPTTNAGFTLSNGDLTAKFQNPNQSGPVAAAASDLYNYLPSGPAFYYEVTIDAWSTQVFLYIGIVNDLAFPLTGQNLSGRAQYTAAFRLAFGSTAIAAVDGAVQSPAGTAATLPAVGDIFGLYCNPSIGIFLSQNGAWVSGDPTTGAVGYGPALTAAMTSNGVFINTAVQIFAGITVINTASLAGNIGQMTANFGPSFAGGGSFSSPDHQLGTRVVSVAQTLFRPTEVSAVKFSRASLDTDKTKRYHSWFRDIKA